MHNAHPAFVWLLWLAPAVAAVFAARSLMHYFQLASYQFGGYLQTLRRQWKAAWLPGLALAAGAFLITYGVGAIGQRRDGLANIAALLGSGLIVVLGLLIGRLSYSQRKAIKPFAITNRIKRLTIALAITILSLFIALRYLLPLLGISALACIALPAYLALAALLALPAEKYQAAAYQRDAARILEAQTGLIRIGITGSWGKTSVKFILKTILSEKYPVLATRKSFNTPMGITRSIREDMRPEHRFFVAEMGARHRGDIRALCRLVRPQIGVLTAVGAQHLETFGDINQVRETKYDLIRALPADGFAVFFDDGAICRELYEKTAKPKALVGTIGSDLWAEDVSLSNFGSSFTMVTGDGVRISCQTVLPGEHNISNILLASAVARHLGLSERQLQRGIAAAQIVESRFQAQKGENGRIVINNGFNSNPESSRQSLELLKTYPGRKIVVTPGFVELGRREKEYNLQLGRRIAQAAQVVLLVGPKHTKPIAQGLLEAGFNQQDIHVFTTLAQANAYLAANAREDDVVLYENDLPDQYIER